VEVEVDMDNVLLVMVLPIPPTVTVNASAGVAREVLPSARSAVAFLKLELYEYPLLIWVVIVRVVVLFLDADNTLCKVLVTVAIQSIDLICI
jgi:hypothetical protein